MEAQKIRENELREHEDNRCVIAAEKKRAYILDRESVLYSGRFYWLGRRIQDVLFSAIALIVLSPLMILVALLIVIESPGAGPIFSQTRVGRDGRLFRFYNLRWMEKWCMAHKGATCLGGCIYTI